VKPRWEARNGENRGGRDQVPAHNTVARQNNGEMSRQQTVQSSRKKKGLEKKNVEEEYMPISISWKRRNPSRHCERTHPRFKEKVRKRGKLGGLHKVPLGRNCPYLKQQNLVHKGQ